MNEIYYVLFFVVLLAYFVYKSRSGNTASKSTPSGSGHFATFKDKYESIEEVQDALRSAGLESSNLILGVDFTKSNEFNGKNTFGGKSLHSIDSMIPNPYQKVMDILGRTLEPFDEDHLIPCFGFGDISTKDRAVFSFMPNSKPCFGFAEALQRYNEIARSVQLSGPTSFAPIIYESIRIVRDTRDYHILVIVADGQVTNEKETIAAIVEASKYPLSIIVVGVGDGPWDVMNEFDDGLPARNFDNFQFVEFAKVVDCKYPEPSFALAALMEIPEQFQAIKKLGILG
eukprot:TRINITY_DN4245_c0_g1_i2.p1 TRINITY_DN4245_c0_g1~~TRINITY_DN4245_c0_g1_i2.p1  ORF type:complete len:286 (-),score=58.25 TRINITY_DN4245_c0_g1_i2:120-977(-)